MRSGAEGRERDMKIEIIEDDRLLGQALEIFLKKEGYETVLARSCRRPGRGWTPLYLSSWWISRCPTGTGSVCTES